MFVKSPLTNHVADILESNPTLNSRQLFACLSPIFPEAKLSQVKWMGIAWRRAHGVRISNRGSREHVKARRSPVWEALAVLLRDRPHIKAKEAHACLREQFPGLQIYRKSVASRMFQWRQANGVALSRHPTQGDRLWADPDSVPNRAWLVIEPMLDASPKIGVRRIGRVLTTQFPGINAAQRLLIFDRARAWRQSNGISKADLRSSLPLTPEQQVLVEENASLAGCVIQRKNWRIPGLSEEDLEQEAYVAMVAAAPRFRQERARASTFFFRAIHSRFCYLLLKSKRTPKLVQQKVNENGRLASEPAYFDDSDQKANQADFARLFTETARNTCGSQRGEVLAQGLLKGESMAAVGKTLGVVRERVRQLRNDVCSRFREQYSEVFSTRQ